MKLPYGEGSWFALALRNGGFAAGLVARATKRGRVILCYFFGPFEAAPTLADVAKLKAGEAAYVALVGDLYLIDGKWPVLGSLSEWQRADWPIPLFVRREPFTERIWLVHRADDNPNKRVREELLDSPPLDALREDRIHGSGAVETVLTKLLSGRRLL
jgi:hypothetical protein